MVSQSARHRERGRQPAQTKDGALSTDARHNQDDTHLCCVVLRIESEWNDVADINGSPLWQNKRCSHVFKKNNEAYDSEGKIFKEWQYDEGGEKYSSCFTSRDSRVPVTFPYTPKSEYVDIGFRED